MSEKSTEHEVAVHQHDATTPIPERTVECGAAISNDRMERFLTAFEASARRWEIVVYPALFAFVVLAAYGFFLVFSLTKDVSVLAESVEKSMSQNLTVVAANMQDVSANVANMSAKMDTISTEMQSIRHEVRAMNPSIHAMAVSTDQMRHDVGGMNRSISPPMHFMRGFMPWF